MVETATPWSNRRSGVVAILVGLSVLTDFLLVPIALSFYSALKGIDRNAMLAAAAFIGLFVVLDLALTWTNIASGIAFSGYYTAAPDDAQRAVIVAAATYPSTLSIETLTYLLFGRGFRAVRMA